jgi:HAD superfamily hydrolase (TIGR01458 family)
MPGVLLDIDGTVTDRGRVIPGAAETIRWLREKGIPFRFATNITRKPRHAIAGDLAALGVDCTADEILTATSATAKHLLALGVHRIALLLPAAAQEEFSGFELGTSHPQVVVVGDLGAQWSFETMNRAFRFLMNGAELLAIQKNRYWNDVDGLSLDCGPFVAALEYASGVTAAIAGKPSNTFFESAAAELGVPKNEIRMVGDDLESDVIGARAAGLLGILVRTGKYREEDEPRAVDESDAVIDSLGDLPGFLGL